MPPTPVMPSPYHGDTSVAAETTKSFDWSPVIYAGVATGILCVVLLTIAVMIRVLRVRTPLTPSMAPSDLGHSFAASDLGASMGAPPSARSSYRSQVNVDEVGGSPAPRTPE